MSLTTTHGVAQSNLVERPDRFVIADRVIHVDRETARGILMMLNITETDDGAFIAHLRNKPLEVDRRAVTAVHVEDRPDYPHKVIPDPMDIRDSCDICGRPRAGRALAVDHDHKSGRLRGYLCSGCNTGIGSLRDSPEIMMRAIAYVTNPPGIRVLAYKPKLDGPPTLRENIFN